MEITIHSYLRLIPKLLLGAWLLASGQLQAQESEQLFNLEQCIDYALENNRQLKNAQLDHRIADHSAKEILAQGLPQVNINADGTYYPRLPLFFIPQPQQGLIIDNNGQPLPYLATEFDLEAMEPVMGDPQPIAFGLPWQANASIGLRQLIADGTYFLGLKAAEVYKEVASKQIDATAEEVASTVSKAYYSALISEESLSLIDANIERTRKLYQDTKALFEEGFAEKIDVERIEINLTNLQMERAKAARLAALSLDMLKFQMGMPVNTSLKLADDARSLEAENPAALQLAEFNPRNRIEYRLLDTQYELETYNMRRFKMGYLPSLYGTASYQLSTQFEELSTAQSFDVGTVGLQLSIPVFDGFRKKHQIQQSKLAMQKIANSKDDLLNSFDLELKNTQAQLENAYANMEAYQRNVDLAEKVFRVSQEKYKEGVGSSLEVNDADSQLKQAQTNYLNGLFEYLDTRVEYQKARGDFSKYHFN